MCHGARTTILLRNKCCSLGVTQRRNRQKGQTVRTPQKGDLRPPLPRRQMNEKGPNEIFHFSPPEKHILLPLPEGTGKKTWDTDVVSFCIVSHLGAPHTYQMAICSTVCGHPDIDSGLCNVVIHLEEEPVSRKKKIQFFCFMNAWMEHIVLPHTVRASIGVSVRQVGVSRIRPHGSWLIGQGCIMPPQLLVRTVHTRLLQGEDILYSSCALLLYHDCF